MDFEREKVVIDDCYCTRCKYKVPATWLVGLCIDEIFGAFEEVCDAHLAITARAIATSSMTPDGRLELQSLTLE